MKHFQLEQHQVRVTCDVSFSVGGALTGKWRVPEHPACLTHNRHLSTSKCFWSKIHTDEHIRMIGTQTGATGNWTTNLLISWWPAEWWGVCNLPQSNTWNILCLLFVFCKFLWSEFGEIIRWKQVKPAVPLVATRGSCRRLSHKNVELYSRNKHVYRNSLGLCGSFPRL